MIYLFYTSVAESANEIRELNEISVQPSVNLGNPNTIFVVANPHSNIDNIN